jgi:hypothetical protein
MEQIDIPMCWCVHLKKAMQANNMESNVKG